MKSIYLDYNATTPIAPSVYEAMVPFLTQHFGNPSSQHAMGRAAHQAIEDAREQVALLVGCEPDEIIFTSGGTESNNLAIRGCMQQRDAYGGHLVVSAVEHPATSQPARFLERRGCALTVVPTDRCGRVDPNEVQKSLRPDTRLVSIMHANNEIGTIQPIRQIAILCHQQGVLVHTDAAQSIGKVRVNVRELDVDLLSIAGHKVYAPKGVGALYVRRGVPLHPILFGASHEQGLRPGTENVASIVGLGHACRLAASGLEENYDRLAGLCDRLYRGLQEAIGTALGRNGPEEGRLPNTLSVNFPGVDAPKLLERVPEICASTGAACHSGSAQASATLSAIGLESHIARGTIRLSLGWNTSSEDIDRAIQLLVGAWESLT